MKKTYSLVLEVGTAMVIAGFLMPATPKGNLPLYLLGFLLCLVGGAMSGYSIRKLFK
jgi:hypothetical protein